MLKEMNNMCGTETGRLHGTIGVCECQSHHPKPGFEESITEILTKEERIEILASYKRILEKNLESIKGEIKRLKEG